MGNDNSLYPIDPQTNPGYYDMLLRPMCLREAGRQLQEAASKLAKEREPSISQIEAVVAHFARNVRLITQNCNAYANSGPTVCASGSELLRIFERLLFDWVLAPEEALPPLEHLDDDKCIEHHSTDDESTVLLCDGCEGKYNITRLRPPLEQIPKGDWYVSHYCFCVAVMRPEECMFPSSNQEQHCILHQIGIALVVLAEDGGGASTQECGVP